MAAIVTIALAALLVALAARAMASAAGPLSNLFRYEPESWPRGVQESDAPGWSGKAAPVRSPGGGDDGARDGALAVESLAVDPRAFPAATLEPVTVDPDEVTGGDDGAPRGAVRDDGGYVRAATRIVEPTRPRLREGDD